MNVEERLRQKKEAVERELERILSQEDTLLFRAMRHAVLSGGKRFRPLLALSSAECFNAALDVALPFACGIEFIHQILNYLNNFLNQEILDCPPMYGN